MRIYFDSNIFVHAFECETDSGHAARRAFEMLDLDKAIGVTSQLTLAELLPRPYEEADIALEQMYERTFAGKRGLEGYPVSLSILRASARLQAQAKMRLADAIHVATAMTAACEFLLSEDTRIRPPPHIRLLRLSDEIFA